MAAEKFVPGLHGVKAWGNSENSYVVNREGTVLPCADIDPEKQNVKVESKLNIIYGDAMERLGEVDQVPVMETVSKLAGSCTDEKDLMRKLVSMSGTRKLDEGAAPHQAEQDAQADLIKKMLAMYKREMTAQEPPPQERYSREYARPRQPTWEPPRAEYAESDALRALQKQLEEANTKLADHAEQLASLKLPFLGDQANVKKPSQRVVFNLGPGGTVSTLYHHVVERDIFLILVYDTRYEGTQYLPGLFEQPITVTIESSKSTYQVYSQDLVLSLGCLDICVLFIEKG